MKKSNKYIAGLTLPILCFAVLVNLAFTPITNNVLADGNKIKPGKRKATLVLSDGSKVELNANTQLIYSDAGGVNVKVDSTGIVYEKEILPEPNNTVKSSEVEKVTLPKEKSLKPETKVVEK